MAPKDILSEILQARKSGQPELLQYSDLAPEDSASILDTLLDSKNCSEDYRFRVHFSVPDRYLRVVIPSRLLEAAASWLIKQYTRWRLDGLINEVADDSIGLQPSPRITDFTGHYAGSVKHPDYSFIPDDPNGFPRHFPSVVLESGWICPGINDCRLWHEGSEGQVRVVILAKLDKPNAQNQIRATLTISHYSSGAGAAATTTQIDVFPVPDPEPANPTLTMEELFAGHCPPGHNSETKLTLDVGKLRGELKKFITERGHLPA